MAGFVAFLYSIVLPGNRRLRMAGLFVAAVIGLAFAATDMHSKGLWLLAAGGIALLYRRPVPAQSPTRSGALDV